MGAGSEALQQMKIAGAPVTGIVHIGANVGQERDEYRVAGEIPVVYVEPIDSVYADLKANVSEIPGHIAVQALCSDSVGEKVRLNISSNNGESSSILDLGRHAELFPFVTYIGKQEMTTTSVDVLLRELDLPCPPNLLVVDTQGSELKVLKGARHALRSVDGIYIEVSEKPLYEGGCTHEEITKYLKPYGFRMRGLAINGMGHGDAFYLKAAEDELELAPSADGDVEDVSLIEALSLLTPFDIDRSKQRIGPQQDGGYVLIPELFNGQPVLSYGIDGEYRFDIQMALRGHPVYMFDHTIVCIRTPDPQLRLNWIKEGVAGRTDKEQLLDTIENQLQKHVPVGNDLILKMDVEGYEYEAFDALPRDRLQRFQQIVFEIHSLHSLPDPVFRARYLRVLRKLNRDFTLFHVHGNDYDGENTYNFIAGVPVSNSLELSYVRSNLVNRRPSETLYPTGTDFPNVHAHDKKLWFFPFLPTTVRLAEFLEAERRMDAVAASAQTNTAQTALESLETPPDSHNVEAAAGRAIRSTKGLLNVALGKPARQSSTSQWSRPGESADAVSGRFPSDFAFHTDIEDSPWWQVDLEAVYPLEAIIVHNRVMDEFQSRARTLKIEVAERENDWVLVHAGFSRFGGAGYGFPFEAWLGGELEARYVRLSLTERQQLHLAQVEVFVRPRARVVSESMVIDTYSLIDQANLLLEQGKLQEAINHIYDAASASCSYIEMELVDSPFENVRKVLLRLLSEDTLPHLAANDLLRCGVVARHFGLRGIARTFFELSVNRSATAHAYAELWTEISCSGHFEQEPLLDNPTQQSLISGLRAHLSNSGIRYYAICCCHSGLGDQLMIGMVTAKFSEMLGLHFRGFIREQIGQSGRIEYLFGKSGLWYDIVFGNSFPTVGESHCVVSWLQGNNLRELAHNLLVTSSFDSNKKDTIGFFIDAQSAAMLTPVLVDRRGNYLENQFCKALHLSKSQLDLRDTSRSARCVTIHIRLGDVVCIPFILDARLVVPHAGPGSQVVFQVINESEGSSFIRNSRLDFMKDLVKALRRRGGRKVRVILVTDGYQRVLNYLSTPEIVEKIKAELGEFDPEMCLRYFRDQELALFDSFEGEVDSIHYGEAPEAFRKSIESIQESDIIISSSGNFPIYVANFLSGVNREQTVFTFQRESRFLITRPKLCVRFLGSDENANLRALLASL